MSISPKSNEKEDIALKPRKKLGHPSMYQVVMLNDDYTPMAFVVKILQNIFEKTAEEATKIMLDIHRGGVGICGIYTFEIAETKISMVMDLSKKESYPLQCEMEKI